jgi:hypothetical protein
MSDYIGTGRTTQQMNEAPPGAVFVWCNGALYYPQSLARKLGRDDLTVRPLSWLRPRNVMGRDFSGVILDHAARQSTEACEALNYVRVRSLVARRKTPNATLPVK